MKTKKQHLIKLFIINAILLFAIQTNAQSFDLNYFPIPSKDCCSKINENETDDNYMSFTIDDDNNAANGSFSWWRGRGDRNLNDGLMELRESQGLYLLHANQNHRIFNGSGFQFNGTANLSDAFSTGSVGFYKSMNNSFNFVANGSNRMVITEQGNIGIGTNTPLSKLHVNGTQTIEGSLNLQGDLNLLDASRNVIANYNSDKKVYNFHSTELHSYKTRFKEIIIPDPNNTYRTTITTEADGTTFINGENLKISGKLLFTSATQEVNFGQGGRFVIGGTSPTNKILFTNSNGASILNVMSNGKIGVGVTSPSELLHVNGNVKATSFLASASSFPDYVFNKDYDLKTLPEVEKFIEENHRLPGMPSEQNVIEEGLNIKEVTTISVEKIEELFLHVIALKKEIELLKKQAIKK